MPREEMLDELTDDFPCQRIYNLDERLRYKKDRAGMMDEVLEGTFENYERIEAESNFRFKIVADAKFDLVVEYNGHTWSKTFDYVTDAFEIGEAAYRLLVVFPRVRKEGESVKEEEARYVIDEESYERHDHCLDDDEEEDVEIIRPAEFGLQSDYLRSTIYKCTDGSFLLSIVHASKYEVRNLVLDRFYADFELAKLLALGYAKHVDVAEFPRPLEATYRHVYSRVLN